MIAIIDYNTGNCGSIRNMLRKIGCESRITADYREILAADRIILPGVGTFDHGMAELHRLSLVKVLEEAVFERRVPILGICLGMQLLTGSSDEGESAGLGWINGRTIAFRRERALHSLKVPHMGWNVAIPRRDHPLLRDLPETARFYFVHSYHVTCSSAEDVLTTTAYGYDFPSAIAAGNIAGVQFHPEKSHKFGMQLLRSFVKDDYCAQIASYSLPALEGRRAG